MSPGDNSQVIHQKTDARLREIASRTRGALGFYALDPVSQERFVLNEHNIFPQASAIKIPIMMELFKQAGTGKFSLSDSRRIEKNDKTGGTGVLQNLGDGTAQMSLRDLCVLMITVSDNTATNILIDLVGMKNINATLESLGLKQTRVQRRMMDMEACAKGTENVSSPAEAARVMELLYRGEFMSRAVCDEMLSIMKKTSGGAVKAGLPAGTPIAFKPGGIAGVVTEWSIVFLKERPYILTIMENYGLGNDASDAIKEISRVLYEHFSRVERATPHGAYVPLFPPELN